jgi:hypothetical protein
MEGVSQMADQAHTLSVRIGAELLKRFKIHCLTVDSNLTAETIKLIEAHLEAQEPKKTRKG